MKINKDLPLFDNKKQEFNVYKNTLRTSKKYLFSNSV